MDYTVCPVDFCDLAIQQEEINTYLGMSEGEGSDASSFFQDQVNGMLQQVSELSGFQFGYVPLQGQIDSGVSIRLSDRTFRPGRVITNCLKGSESFIILLATIGPQMDRWLHEKQAEGDIVKTFIADALGSVVVEAIIAHALEVLEREAAGSGLRISNSYSPGYCGWDVSEQQQLFALLPPHFCGVRLTESSLMLPVKSVSALIGSGSTLVRKPYGCAICRKKDCFKRKKS